MLACCKHPHPVQRRVDVAQQRLRLQLAHGRIGRRSAYSRSSQGGAQRSHGANRQRVSVCVPAQSSGGVKLFTSTSTQPCRHAALADTCAGTRQRPAQLKGGVPAARTRLTVNDVTASTTSGANSHRLVPNSCAGGGADVSCRCGSVRGGKADSKQAARAFSSRCSCATWSTSDTCCVSALMMACAASTRQRRRQR